MNLFAGVLVLMLALAGHRAVAVDLSKNTVFSVAFDSGVTAIAARGDVEPVSPGTFTSVAGVHGKGIRVDRKVQYAVPKEMKPSGGALSFFARPAAPWTDGKKRPRLLISCVGGRVPGKLLNAVQVYLDYSRPRQRWELRLLLTGESEAKGDLSIVVDAETARAWQEAPDRWSHIIVSWNVADMLLAVDGRICTRGPKLAKTPVVVPRKLADTFSLEPEFCFDQLLIFNRALDREEVSLLFKSKGEDVKMTPPPVLAAPLFPVPKCIRPPTVDGRIEADEWQQACAMTGFLELSNKEFCHRQGEFWLTYDASNLYFAYRSSFPPGKQEGGAWDEKALRAFARNRDGKVFLDDSIEVYLAPEAPEKYIQFITNCLGTINDRRYGEIPWDGDWRVHSHVDDGAGSWELEGAISFASIGVPAPAIGDAWSFNVARNWKGMEVLFTSITGEYRKKMAKIVFSDTAPAVQERSWGKPLAGLPALDLSLRVPGDTTMEVQAEWGVHNVEGNIVPGTAGEKTLQISSEESRFLQQQSRITEPGPYAISVAMRDVGTGQLLYERQLPFSVTTPITLKPFYVLETRTLGVLTDLTRLPLNPLTDCERIDYTVTAEDRALAKQTVHEVDNGRFGLEFAVQPPVMPEADLSLSCRFTAKDGTIFQTQTDYHVPPVPGWLGKYEPPEDFVPSPWSPVKMDSSAGSVHCGNRTYTFGTQPLPSSVRVGERELLAGPISLDVRSGEVGVRWASGAVSVANVTPSAVTVTKTGKVGHLEVAVETTVEFDGYAVCRILLTPRQPVTVSEVVLTVPLRGEFVRFFHVNGKWGDKLFGPVARRDEFPVLRDERHFYWLGDDDTGFCWLAEGLSDWRPGTDRPRIGFEKSDDGWLAYLRPVGEDIVLAAPIIFEIGFQATPTRPPPPRPIRALLCYNTPPEKLSYTASRIGDTVLEMSLKGKMNYPPFPDEADTIRGWIAGHKAKGMKFVPYQYIDAGTETDTYAEYWGDWVTTLPPDTMQWRTLTAKCCLGTSWSDYVCSVLDTMMTEFDSDGVYLDGVMARECRRGTTHGHEGKADWPISAARAHVKKLLYVARKNKGPDSVLFGHVSIGTIAPLAGLLDLHLKGENYGSPLDYDSLTPEVMRAEFGRQWGPPSVLLPQLTKKQAIPTGRLLGLAALHGVECAPSFLPPKERQELLFPMWTIFEEFRIDTATFHPYWKQQLFSEATGRPLSVYAHADTRRYLLIAANQTDAPTQFEVSPASALVITGARERFGNQDLARTAGTFILDLDPWEYQLVEISAEH